MEKTQIKELVSKLTLDEKISLTTGKNSWETVDIDRLGIPSLWMSDGPHGLRKGFTGEDNNLDNNEPAVSFPAEVMMGSSFDRDLIYELGEELGVEAQGRDVHLLLGPGINMKRSPLCGRNFEYMSEDPYLAGELASSYINGIQSQGVGACVKHFFANNQETRRFSISADVSNRAIREIYLAAFERVIKKSNPWAVMAAYNKVNGVQGTENGDVINGILRGEWGYDGCVISDWGATHHRGKVLKAGTDLTMPGEKTNEFLKKFYNEGLVTDEDLDKACENILQLVFKGIENHKDGVDPRMEHGHDLVRRVAAESAVLLKNDKKVLPLKKNSRVAFIGGFCKQPRYQGGGSSHVTVTKMTYPLTEAEKIADVIYSPGYKKDGSTTDDLIAHAIATAKQANAAVLFVGLPDSYEFEGGDRQNMKLPEGHSRLIAAVCNAVPNTVVVLNNGAPIEMPWVDMPKAILEMYLGGEAVGEATCDVLFGDVNPSGRLAETFPVKYSDTPAFFNFPGELEHANYAEGVYIGYRYYTTKRQEVRYPFGYGLSYTSFAYSNLSVSSDTFDGSEDMQVKVDVTNTGALAGKEVVQLYVGVKDCKVMRPVVELKGFDKISLEPGETKTVQFTLCKRDFQYFDEEVNDFMLAGGDFVIYIGKSAAEYVLSAPVKVIGEPERVIHPLIDEDPATRFMEKEFGRKYLEDNRAILEEAAGTTLEEYINTHKVWEIKCISPKLPYMEWNLIIDQFNDRY